MRSLFLWLVICGLEWAAGSRLDPLLLGGETFAKAGILNASGS